MNQSYILILGENSPKCLQNEQTEYWCIFQPPTLSDAQINKGLILILVVESSVECFHLTFNEDSDCLYIIGII